MQLTSGLLLVVVIDSFWLIVVPSVCLLAYVFVILFVPTTVSYAQITLPAM